MQELFTSELHQSPKFEFHVSRSARDRYHFDESLFSTTGNVVFANVRGSREFANRMNQARDVARYPERAVHPGALNAMGLVDEVLHAVTALYREQRDPKVMLDGLAWFEQRLGSDALNAVLARFSDEFPTVAVYRGEQSPEEWLRGSTAGIPHAALALEEVMMLWLANANPAFRTFAELFDDTALAESTVYSKLASGLREYFETRPRFGPENQNLFDLLRAPALASPDSLEGQLAFMRDKWSVLLGDMVRRLLTALDVLKEEQVAIWMRFHPHAAHFGAGMGITGDSSAAAIPRFSRGEVEYERFSPDVDWMPRTVMMAKSVYVWLDQLSKNYHRRITMLSEVPDEELDTMARRGFSALWLIGVWERSKASRTIKQIMGNPEAAASAYSLADYAIAQDLGGEGAYVNLRDRAWKRGIRLASDMVPNHMGIDSRWVIQHPDWFLSLPYSPYPSYTFNGPDLSSDGRVEIKIEDHYYNHTDAAVVFRRADRWSGDTRYVYHGNDGTSYPWNDTAQLNYLNAEVREAVIQTILHVARLFPIIRFDAAMTLAKQHYQRLWFPQPGTGGAIPSRAEHGLTKEQFDAAMPVEFWRELVDRVAAEVPGTLLLAEAFWLLEGYFVRTLGMHRVYNSAFMNMLRDEENANYRSVIKNTLEFDPEVLKRYVNFMNNPDERTAVDQFGKGDKYFGVCTVMVTMPGLPMFGHGQIEGFAERYGMEYRRAYKDEQSDTWLVARHEREISPLLHRRPLFADVREFLFYDFFTDHGHVNEDVFAYSNRVGDQRALIVYHNRYADTSGWVRTSCAYAEKAGDGGRRLRQRTLGEALGLSGEEDLFIASRDAITGLEYLHRNRDVLEKGVRLELGAYKCHVFVDFRDLKEDEAHPWRELYAEIGGRGVSSLDDALRGLRLKPVRVALKALLEPDVIRQIVDDAVEGTLSVETERVLSERIRRFLADAQLAAAREGRPETTGEAAGNVATATQDFVDQVRAAVRLPALEAHLTETWPEDTAVVLPSEDLTPVEAAPVWGAIVAWAAIRALGSVRDQRHPDKAGAEILDALRLREAMAEGFEALGLVDEDRWRAAARVRVLLVRAGTSVQTPFAWVHDPDVAWLLGVHDHEGVRYFSKERFEELAWWFRLPELLRIARQPKPDTSAVLALEEEVKSRLQMAEDAGYKIESLLETLEKLPTREPTR